eukprot:6201997-Pleurochrysis_carterae.AAC.2
MDIFDRDRDGLLTFNEYKGMWVRPLNVGQPPGLAMRALRFLITTVVPLAAILLGIWCLCRSSRSDPTHESRGLASGKKSS